MKRTTYLQACSDAKLMAAAAGHHLGHYEATGRGESRATCLNPRCDLTVVVGASGEISGSALRYSCQTDAGAVCTTIGCEHEGTQRTRVGGYRDTYQWQRAWLCDDCAAFAASMAATEQRTWLDVGVGITRAHAAGVVR